MVKKLIVNAQVQVNRELGFTARAGARVALTDPP
jgi:hypothetical protein